ncbi:MAG: CoA-binding protein [Ignavibacteriae bacterium]|nr:CoA-binding protein [Ignavibacteriota bacterium]MCB9205786.1 CoA-binding protein [Ignavibacteriales bacterium]MCB9209948.1 CoA-binding protein [Ignavibacteriales bacterium]MCB9219337.1 CoA-binding protein [Ignavibacteriales bacterium]MCB9260224.1 CoA-binding protein [Ignavibacteriales bacterium]
MQTEICEILKTSKTIAVVGISSNPSRISRNIALYLLRNGYNVVGVNPNMNFNNADGIVVYNSLKEIPHKIDIVNVFRKSEDIPFIMDDVLEIMPKTLWLQLGIRNDDAVEKVLNKGVNVIQDSCIKVEHSFCF